MRPSTPICACPACRWRSLRAPLLLIALGVLLLLHMTRPSWTVPVAVGAFLIYLGAYTIIENLLPEAETPGGHRSGSHWAGPIVLIAIGGILVAIHAIAGFRAGDWLARYWPLLFIIWGVGRLVEYYTAPGRRRSGLSAGEIVLLIFLILGGLAFSGAYRFRQSPWVRYMGLHVEDWNPMFEPYDFNGTAAAPLAAGERVEVYGYRGSVRLIAAGAGAPQVSATVADRIHAADQAGAARLFQSAQPRAETDGDVLLVSPAGGMRNGQVDANLLLTLPAATPVTVTLNSGDIEADNWRAPLQLTTGHSQVRVRNLNGNLDLTTTSDSIDLEQIQGSVSVHGTGNNVTLADITGDATLQGEYSGMLRFRNLAHGLTFDSMRTTLAVTGLPGDIDGSLDRLDFHATAVNIRLETRDKQLSISSFTGPLEISDTNSSIRLHADKAPSDAITVSTTNGDIDLGLPSDSRFSLDATAHNGDIRSDFDVPTMHRGSTTTAEAVVGGAGPQITLTTRNGSISVHRR